jgi:hypothetical protein
MTMQQAIIVLAALSVAAKIAVSGGLPALVATCLYVLTAVAAIAATLAGGANRWLDGPRLVLILLALYYVPSVHTRVGGDGIEYYVQSRSILFDRDLNLENDYRGLGAAPVRSAQGAVTSRFPVGLPLFWLPALALTHVSATLASWLGASVETNGFSPVYQTAVNVTTFLCGFIALVLMEGFLRRRHGKAIAFLVVVALWLATPLHFYLTANPFMSHGLSVLLATCFVLAWLKARDGEDKNKWLLTGIWGGLLMLVRVQNAVLLLLPIIDLAFGRTRRLQSTGSLLVGPLICGFLQAGIWVSLYGANFVEIVFLHGKIAQTFPHGVEFLFSPRHGLLTWTPLFIGALFGWVLVAQRSPKLGLAVWVGFLAAVAINSSTGDWWGSESFGQRRMLGWIPLFALGLGETFNFFRHRPLIPLAVTVGALILWNHQLAYIYNAELVTRRDQPVTLDRLMDAQIDLLYRRLLASYEWMPQPLWVLLYDHLKGVWLVEGGRSLRGKIDLGNEPAGYYPLVGDGWFPEETENGVSYRLSRGRRSFITVPIRRPVQTRIVLRARWEASGVGEGPVRVGLAVNGKQAGERTLVEGWSEYVFDIPKDGLRVGLNGIVLTYSSTPRMNVPGFHGRNAVLAVDWIDFR